jgi:hypothetical protein
VEVAPGAVVAADFVAVGAGPEPLAPPGIFNTCPTLMMAEVKPFAA